MIIQTEQYHRFLSWLKTEIGRQYLMLELDNIAMAMRQAHGNHLLLIGSSIFNPIKEQGCFAHTYTININSLKKKLIYQDDFFDCIVLPHTLEFVSEPQLILREIQRLLHPEGLLLISGFCPQYYTYLISRWYGTLHIRQAISGRFLSKELRKLEFEEVNRKLFSSKKWYRYLPLLADAYIITAIQHRFNVKPLHFKAQRLPRFSSNIGLATNCSQLNV